MTYRQKQNAVFGFAFVVFALGMALIVFWMFSVDLTNQPEQVEPVAEVELVIETINTYELNGEIYDCIHYTNGGMDCTLGSDPDVGGGWMPPEELP